MNPVKEIKKVEVDVKKCFVPTEDAEREEFLLRALVLHAKLKEACKELAGVKDRLIKITEEFHLLHMEVEETIQHKEREPKRRSQWNQ